jgi:outer membrane receptor protein involved in Fe transport
MNSNYLKETAMIRSIRGLRALVFAMAALLLVWGVVAEAQTFRGTILGTVMDSSGAAVSGATVTVKNLDTGLTRVVTTSDDGSYNVPELPIGSYTVSVEKTGFRIGVVSGLRVEVSTQVRADVTLQPGEITQKVEVTGESLPQVETTTNTLGGIVEASVVTNLPINGRDFQKLIYLVPGVSGSPDQITDSPGSYGIFTVNGARGRSNNFLLDGTDMNDGYRNDPAINEAGVFGTPATILPVEAVAELRILSNFEAEYGRSAGGVINTVTKSGTNTFHGSALEYFRNTALNARNYFDETKNGPQQPFHNNQFGGSLGGPIVKDKTFFFADYEATRETGAQSSPACVPTAADITAHTPEGGINPVIANLLNLNNGKGPWPTPTTNVSCLGGGNNAALATPFSNRVDNIIAKIDHQLNANDLLTGRYYFGDSDQSFPLALTGGGLLPNYNTSTPTRVQLISLSYVKVINPSVVNEARLGWNRFAEGFYPQDRSFNPASIGLNTGVSSYNYGMPVINVANFAQLGADKADPRQRVDTNWHFIDNLSWKRGKHDVKFGYEFRRTSVSQMFNRTFRGRLKFATLDDFLAGTPTGGTQGQGNTNRNAVENSNGFYIQDSFRWTKNVTLNFGVRYDIYGVIKEKHGNFTNIDSATGAPILVGSGNLYNPDYNNFAPRVSIAWDVTGKGKTVIRTGYGIFYDAFSQDLFMGHIPWSSSFDPGPAYSGFGPNPISFASPVATLVLNSPVFANPAPMGDAFGVDKNLRTPYMQNFNLNLQQELTKHMVLQLGYVGSTGHKLFRFRDINQPTQATIQAFDYKNGGGFVPRRLNPNFTYIYQEESSSSSNYHSLQASWRINDWHGLTTAVNYTWSHSIDDASDGEDYVPNAAQPTNSTLPSSNRGNSNFDVRNHFGWNFIYQFPNLKGSWSRLTDGWGINGVATIQSGQPFHIIYSSDDYDGSGTYFAKPDVVGPIVFNRGDPYNFLDLSAFAVPCSFPQVGDVGYPGNGSALSCKNGSFHYGNLGRNSLEGPKFRQFDFSLFKDTVITERLKMQLRAEVYNLLNHPNFSNPVLPNFYAAAEGNGIDPVTGRSSGPLRLGTTGDVGIGYPFLGSGGPRGIQLAVRFTF